MLYIAETNASNQVEWVWVRNSAGAVARPFDRERDRFDPKRAAEFHGAPVEAFVRWMTREQ